MKKIIQSNKKYLTIVGFILIVGLLVGIFYYNLLNTDLKSDITNTLINYNNFRYNSIFKDLIIMSILLISSVFIIGIPCSIFYLFYESFSLGFLISIFTANFKLSGLLYILLYILINKGLVLILMILFIKKVINISRHIIGVFIYRQDNMLKNKININFKNSLYIIVFILIINIFLYLITPSIFEWLSYLLK